MTEAASKFTCPMSAMCKGMANKPHFGMGMMIPGLVLIGVGVLVLFHTEILAWLVAILMIMMGVGLLFMANMMRKFGIQTNTTQDQ